MRIFSPLTITVRWAATPGLVMLLVLAALELHGGADKAAADGPILAIDAGIQGNQATAIGPIENCIPVKTGDEFQMDIVVQNISDLLAWETYLEYDPAILTVIDQNVKLFQQANAGSSVLDISGRVPDDTGLHYLAAFDSSDPPTPDSGSGVLARVTFRAVGPGQSPVRFANRDLNGDGVLDKGTLLRDTNAHAIGDANGDTFFDGEEDNAAVAVDQACPAGSVVASAPSGQLSSAGSSSFPWLIAFGAAAGALAILGAGAVVLLSRRRQAARRTVPDETS